MSLDKLLDNDIYETYLLDLSTIEIELYCKNFSPHLKEGVEFGRLLIKGVKKFLNDTFEKDIVIPETFRGAFTPESFYAFNTMMIESYIAKTLNENLVRYDFKFQTVLESQFEFVIDQGLADSVNFESLSAFKKKAIYALVNFPNNRLKPDFEDLLVQLEQLERQFAKVFEKIITSLDEYVLYYDQRQHQFKFELKD